MPSFYALTLESCSSQFPSKRDAVFAYARQGLVSAIFSAGFVYFIGFVSKDLHTAIVTFLSVIVGFSYSIMIFISSSPFVRPSDLSDREGRLRASRLNDLVKKLYVNLHHFCIYCLIMISMSIVGIAASDAGEFSWYGSEILFPYFDNCAPYINFIFIFLLIGIMWDLMRILDRTHYIFSTRVQQFCD